MIILFVILFIILCYRCKGIRNIYLPKSDTTLFILKDADRYVCSMTLPDLYARKVESCEEYIHKCAFNALDFTENDIYILEQSTMLADEYFKTLNNPYIDNIKMNEIPWKFALTTNEEGLPHTRSDIIFLSPSVMKQQSLVSILIHEKVHIYQRKYLKDFQNLLIQNGYYIVGERSKYPLARSNPDLDGFVYADKNGNIMITLYNNTKPTGINDVSSESKHEHPFETIAYQIGDNYM